MDPTSSAPPVLFEHRPPEWPAVPEPVSASPPAEVKPAARKAERAKPKAKKAPARTATRPKPKPKLKRAKSTKRKAK